MFTRPNPMQQARDNTFDDSIVYVVDDDEPTRRSLSALFRSVGLRAETFGSTREFLPFPKPAIPSCIVLDVRLPHESGLELQQQLLKTGLSASIVFISGHGDIPMTVQAMKGGAVEFLTKPVREEVLLNAIQHAIERSRSSLDREARSNTLRDCYATLTRREREVMALLVLVLLNKQVAGELGISEITVKQHRGKVMEKMKAGSFAALVNMGVELRLATPAKS